MKQLARLLLLSACVGLALLLPAFAEELPEPDLAADAKLSGNAPPTPIPHPIGDDADGNACNQCHVGSAKMAPHPDRINCTQCHVAGDLKKKSTTKAGKKGTRK